MVPVEGGVPRGARPGAVGFVAAVEGAVVEKAEGDGVDIAAVGVEDRQAQAAVGAGVEGALEVDAQPQGAP